ncbi:isochorismatase family protein, partial [Streptococcus hyovaginalis]
RCPAWFFLLFFLVQRRPPVFPRKGSSWAADLYKSQALYTLLHPFQVKNLILTGIAEHICVLCTANDAYMREYPLLIPTIGIASVDKEDKQ